MGTAELGLHSEMGKRALIVKAMMGGIKYLHILILLYDFRSSANTAVLLGEAGRRKVLVIRTVFRITLYSKLVEQNSVSLIIC